MDGAVRASVHLRSVLEACRAVLAGTPWIFIRVTLYASLCHISCRITPSGVKGSAVGFSAITQDRRYESLFSPCRRMRGSRPVVEAPLVGAAEEAPTPVE